MTLAKEIARDLLKIKAVYLKPKQPDAGIIGFFKSKPGRETCKRFVVIIFSL